MIFALLTLLAALGLAAVAGWFSIIGIMSIYAGAAFHALVMGVALEAGKLVTTSWLYRNWEYSDWKLKIPLIVFTLTLMLATSIGVFGFLSKAHLEQGAGTVDNSAKIERLDQQIAREKATIDDDQKVTQQLDSTINSYLGKDRTDKSLAVRKSQAPQRKQLRDDIDAAQKRIDGFSDEKLKLTSELRKQQLDVGPIRYIAELWYGTDGNADKNIESAVRIFTLIIVSSLDPLAVILLIAANHTLMRRQREKEEKNRSSGQVQSSTREDRPGDSDDQNNGEEIKAGFEVVKEDVPTIGSKVHDTILFSEDEAIPTEVLPEIREDLNEEIKIIETRDNEIETGTPIESSRPISSESLPGIEQDRQDDRYGFPTEQATAPALSEQFGSEVHEINEEVEDTLQGIDQGASALSYDNRVAMAGGLYPTSSTKTDKFNVCTPIQDATTVQEINEEAPTFDDLHEANAENEGMWARDPSFVLQPNEINQISDLESEIRETGAEVDTDTTVQEEMAARLDETQISTLEKFQSLLDVQVPPPIIRTPSPSRLEKVSDSSGGTPVQTTTIEVEPWKKSEVNVPWTANQSMLAELIGSRPHFIPQKLNEEDKQEKVETATAQGSNTGQTLGETNDVSPTIEKVQEIQDEGSDKASKDTTIQHEGPVTFRITSSSETDKYPKALSWLNEFKRT